MWKLRWDIGINATGQFYLGHPVEDLRSKTK